MERQIYLNKGFDHGMCNSGRVYGEPPGTHAKRGGSEPGAHSDVVVPVVETTQNGARQFGRLQDGVVVGFRIIWSVFPRDADLLVQVVVPENQRNWRTPKELETVLMEAPVDVAQDVFYDQ